jgi:ribosomal protein L7Ae-like RNA K-turn-binding protein
MLGLCQRAGKLASGDLAAEQALKRHKADLLILASDASERTVEKFTTLAERAGVACYLIGTRDELGLAIGKSHRAALAVQSKDFLRGLSEMLAREGVVPVKGRG